MMSVLFAKDKTAGSQTRFLKATNMRPYTLQVDGDLGTDEITITGAGINGTDETTLDADVVLTADMPWHTFYGPVRIIINMPVTTNNVGLMELS